MDILTTPEERFRDLPGYDWAPNHVAVADGLRMAYIDEGPRGAPPVLCLHGEPSWGFLYRKLVGPLIGAGLRVIVPDLIGFGRSDKPAAREDYSYLGHVTWTAAFLDALTLTGITLVCHDWGGLIGLRLVGEQPDRFARVVATNTFLPTGDQRPSEAFFAWQRFSQETPEFPAGRIIAGACARPLGEGVQAAYDAPFPDETYKAGARQFPMLVPARPDDPASEANRAAWESLRRFERPFLTAFGDSDPLTRGADLLLQAMIPGAKGQPHTTLARAGHFLQEDVGDELAQVVASFVNMSA